MRLICNGKIFILGAVLAASFFVNAGETGIDVQMAANHISLVPAVQYEQAVLKVRNPDGEVQETVFGHGAALVYSTLVDGVAADGLYVWELTLKPVLDEKDRDMLLNARKASDGTQMSRNEALPPLEALRHSGHFRVVNGSVFVGLEVEESGFEQTKDLLIDQDEPGRDQVILDDLIVDGSACIGMDCVNGESFGFDTLRLKENNLRIKFEDTSASASFPSNDWQLTANDSANGGANKFSIDDIDGGRTPFTIEAGAPSHSFYVDDSGRLGLGTSTPVVEAHMVDGDTPTLRLEQDGSSGFTPQTWDVAGNETNFFIRDATNGSTLPFKIRPGAPSNSVYINTNGDVGLGTTSPSARLDVMGDLEVNGDVSVTGTFNTLNYQASGSGFPWEFGQNRTDDLTLAVPGSGGLPGNQVVLFKLSDSGNLTITGALSQGSDVNSKHNIRAIDSSEILLRLAALPILEWQYRDDESNALHIGPMAQDFFASFGLGIDERHISTIDTGGVALAAIQALLSKVETKEHEIEQLQRENDALGERLSKLEAAVLGLN